MHATFNCQISDILEKEMAEMLHLVNVTEAIMADTAYRNTPT